MVKFVIQIFNPDIDYILKTNLWKTDVLQFFNNDNIPYLSVRANHSKLKK